MNNGLPIEPFATTPGIGVLALVPANACIMQALSLAMRPFRSCSSVAPGLYEDCQRGCNLLTNHLAPFPAIPFIFACMTLGRGYAATSRPLMGDHVWLQPRAMKYIPNRPRSFYSSFLILMVICALPSSLSPGFCDCRALDALVGEAELWPSNDARVP